MPLQEKKSGVVLLSAVGQLVLVLIVCVSMTVLWCGSPDAQMRPEQFIQRDESRLESKPPPAVPKAVAPAPPVIVVEPPRKAVAAPPPARVSDDEIQKLRLVIEELTKQVAELKSQIKKNKRE